MAAQDDHQESVSNSSSGEEEEEKEKGSVSANSCPWITTPKLQLAKWFQALSKTISYYLVFDLEMTQSSIQTGKVIQVAFVMLDNEGKEVGRFDSYIHYQDKVKISPHVRNVLPSFLTADFLQKTHEDRDDGGIFPSLVLNRLFIWWRQFSIPETSCRSVIGGVPNEHWLDGTIPTARCGFRSIR